MRTFLVVLSIAIAALAAPSFAAGDEAAPVGLAAAEDGYVAPVCDDPDISTLAVSDCTGAEAVPSLDTDDVANPPSVEELTAKAEAAAALEPSPADLPTFCRLHANIYFYTSSDWLRLGQKLQANASPCADYYISIPGLAADKTQLRCAQDDVIRALGSRFHPVVEFHFQEMPASRGIIWVIGVGHGSQNLGVYKGLVQSWLQDSAFWEDMARDVSVWGQEAYPNMLFWGDAAASRNARTRNLSLFLEHPLLLAEAGPPTVTTSLDFLEQTYVPLGSAAWPYKSGYGNTWFSDDKMKRFISEQTFAVKHFSQSRPHAAPDARFALAWAPNTQCGTDLCKPASIFQQRTAGILERLASAIRESYEFGGGSQVGACGTPGDYSWCDADIDGAVFNPLWSTFPDW